MGFPETGQQYLRVFWEGLIGGGDRYTLARFVFGFVVLPQNVEQEPEAAADCNEKADHGEAGIAKKQKPGLDPHQQSSANDESRKDQARSNTIGDFLRAFDEKLRLAWPDVHLQLGVPDCVEDFIQSRRQRTHELFGFEQGTKQAAFSEAGFEALIQ